ncbi:hypothetical protein BJV74DRAFT_781049 [Russula compacta]|nr:hypothetical protein BJV74DRAFT_781049 [Russula compacta]
MSTTKHRRAHFNPNPIAEVRSIPYSTSPASSTSSLAASPGPSTPPPLPNVAFSPTNSPLNSSTLSPYPSPPHPRVYIPSPIPQAHALPYIPPPPLISNVYIHPAVAAPSLSYDMRYPPSQSNPVLSPAVLTTLASNPPLPHMGLRIGDLPWLFPVVPDVTNSPGNGVVTVRDVLVAIYLNLRTAVKANEYEAMGKSRKSEIFRAFEHRVRGDPAQRGKGLRRVDFLCGRFRAQGLVRAQSKDNVWDVVIH